MIIGKPSPFVSVFIDAVNDAICHHKQLPENLSWKGCVPIRGSARDVTGNVSIIVVLYCGAPHMRTLKLPFSDDALPTLNTFLKQTKEARVFRRAQAVRDVVQGQRLQTVSDTLHFTYSALRKWVYRFAHQGTQGLVDRPRSGRPPKVTCELEQHLNRLVDQDPLQHGARSSQWSCRELAAVLAQQTGIQLGRESVRGVLKKTR
jgi:transposase